jgi:VWFA-related protein
MSVRNRAFRARGRWVLGVALVIGLAALRLRAEQEEAPRPRTTFVELDAVVVDGHDRPIRGLQRDDFEIKDDGRTVAVTSFTEVSAAGIDGHADARYLVLLLDDTGIGPLGTVVVQNIARLLLSRARPADAVAVVRLTHHDDEVAGDLQSALERVDEYRARSVPYFGRETIEESLQVVTRISRRLEPVEHRRKTLVCVGRRNLCDLYLPVPEETLVWPFWRDAMRATARANVSVYLVDPAGVSGGVDLGDGLVDQTGGADFVASNNFQRAADRIWDEAGHYYLLGYTPTAPKRDLHTIDVKVKRAGSRVRARRRRGD